MRAQTCARREEREENILTGLSPAWLYLSGRVIYQLYKAQLPDLTTGATALHHHCHHATTNMNQLFEKNSPSTQSIQLAWGLWPRVSLLDYNDKFMPITLITVGAESTVRQTVPTMM